MRLFPDEPRATRRAVVLAWASVALLAICLALWLVVTVVHLSDENRQTQAVNAAQDSALAEANRRLTEAGEQPVPTPEPGPAGEPGQIGEQGEPGPPGAHGDIGPPGPPGPRGLMGRPGRDGIDGARGATGATGAPGPKGDPGAPGSAGADGKDGTDGQDGQDAFPFTFRFTIQTNPAQTTTYTVTCQVDGCTVTES